MLHFCICFFKNHYYYTTSYIIIDCNKYVLLIAVTIHDFLTEFLLVTILGRPLCIQVKSTR